MCFLGWVIVRTFCFPIWKAGRAVPIPEPRRLKQKVLGQVLLALKVLLRSGGPELGPSLPPSLPTHPPQVWLFPAGCPEPAAQDPPTACLLGFVLVLPELPPP